MSATNTSTDQVEIQQVLDILHRWGIHTLGQLAELDKDELGRRLGPTAVCLWERANGKSIRLLKLVPPVESFAETFEFENEIETAEPLLFMLRRFLEQLSERLAAFYLVAKELTLKINFSDASERLTKDDEVEGENNDDPEPEKEKERDDVFRPPVTILGHAVGMAKRARNCGNEKSAEVNAEENAGSREGAPASSDDDAGDHAVEYFLDFGIGRKKSAYHPKHLVQLCRVGSEKAKKMPQKKQTWREREQHLVGHLRRKAHRFVSRGLPEEPPHHPARQAEEFHRHAKFTLPLRECH